MKQKLLIFLLLMGAISYSTSAQTTLNTTVGSTGYTGTNSAGNGFAITFDIENTSSSPILLTDVGDWTSSTDDGKTFTLYYSSTSLSGTPPTTYPAAGWTQVATNTVSSLPSTLSVNNVISSMTFMIPGGTTYRFALHTTGTRRYSGTGAGTCSPNTFTASGINLYVGDYQISGSYVGYGATNNPRFFTGSVTFIPASACTAPPTAGNAVVSNTNPCLNQNITLSLSGASFGTGQTYQWEDSLVGSGSFAPITGATSSTSIINVSTSGVHYYRCAVICSGQTSNSTPVLSTVPSAFPGGIYTIDASSPASATNFQSFTAAASAIGCGISGPVVFNVVPGSGPYNEQLILPATIGATATNTVTFNGNGDTLSFASTNTNLRGIIRLDGADHITIDSMVIISTGTTTSEYGFGVQLINDADSNTISHCKLYFDQASTSANYAGIVMSGSETSATTTGSNCDGNVIDNNTIEGGYYGITCLTTTDNQIKNNKVLDFYFYGIYTNANSNILIDANEVARPNRVAFSSFYGIYQGGTASNNKITKNRIHDPFAGNTTSTSAFYGIYLSSSDATSGNETEVSNNELYNLNGGGTMYILYNTGSNYVNYYHNTIACNDATYSGTSITRGFYQTTSANNINFKNNIISITRSTTGASYCMYWNTAASTISSDYNVLYVDAFNSAAHIGYKSGNQNLLSDWQTATSGDANSMSLSPIFANQTGGDLQPTNSLVDDKGTPLGVLTDILGATRSTTTPDVGAVEFAIPLCFGQPTAGTAAAPLSVCSGIDFTLSLSGFTIGNGISIQWEYFDNISSMWTAIAGATTPNYTMAAGITSATDFRATVTCANGGANASSNTLSLSILPFYACYCTSAASNASLEELFNVSVGLLNNASDCTTGNNQHTDYTGLTPANLPQTASAPISLSLGTCSTTGSSSIAKVFIDYNQNGSYSDAGEEVYVSPTTTSSATGTVVMGNIVVPATATLGQTGMRVVMVRTSSVAAVTPCATYTYGETEDYIVNITTPPTCISPLNAIASNILAASADISWSPSTSSPANGYEWRLFPIGTGPYGTALSSGNEPAGDTMASVTGLTPITDYSFYVRSACSATDTSTWISVNFTTPCSTFVSPYVQSFDNITTPACMNNTGPENWLFTTGSGPGYGVAGSTDHTGNSGAFAWVDGSGSGDNMGITLTTPIIDISALTTPKLRYYVISHDVNNTNGNNKLIVEGLNGSTWVQVDSVQQNFPTAGWNERNILLSGLISSSTTQFRFRVDEQGGVITGFTSFYNDILIDDISVYNHNPLVIKLDKIAATNVGTRNRIDWNTTAEVNGDKFTIERSLDGKTFTTLATKEANGFASVYSYWDETPAAGINYYRLKMIDAAGNNQYSTVVNAKVKQVDGFYVEAFPNPAKTVVTVKLHGNIGSNPTIIITDVAGKVMRTITNVSTTNSINLEGLSAGVYFIKYSDDNATQIVKFNKQ